MAYAEYPRRILLAVTGLSPQVVTETLYALAQEDRARVPTEIHLITTARGLDFARLNLLSDDPGWFHRLCRDYDLPPIAFPESHIHVLTDAAGQALSDIRTPEDNEAAADFIAAKVAQLCEDEAAAVHVSIAGGRKTMGYYAGYALSLYGRAQDRLSHVLVESQFESHPQFYYPTPYSRIIHTNDREQRPLDCRQARVWLAEIPFVRLREELPPRLLAGRISFTAACAAVARAFESPRLEILLEEGIVRADEQPLELSRTEIALLWWLAERVRRGEDVVDWSQPEAAQEFLDHARSLMGEMSAEYERCEKAVRDRIEDHELLAQYFEPHRSRIKKSFVTALGPRAAERYLIHNVGTRGRPLLGLGLPPEAIEIRNSPKRASR